jgi:hypothetical protein
MLGLVFDIDQFSATGIGHLPGAFGSDDASAMRATLWRYIEERSVVRQTDPSTWPEGAYLPPGLSLRGLKGRAVFAPLTENRLLGDALDAIFGEGGWTPPKRGGRILLTFPSARTWTMPTGWHMDDGFDRQTVPVPWVQVWAFLVEVGPYGGGTLVLAGSHRLVERYSENVPPGHRGSGKVNWERFMKQYPFLDRLRQGGGPEAPLRELLGMHEDVDGIPMQAIELTGNPGDMFITHGRVFHCVSPNAGDHPRQMMTAAVTAR